MPRVRFSEAARIEIAHLAAELAEERKGRRSAERKSRSLQRRVETLERLLANVQAELVKAKQTVREYARQIFGRHSERGPVPGSAPSEGTDTSAGEVVGASPSSPSTEEPAPPHPTHRKQKKRGRRPGHPGSGRRTVEELPCTTEVRTLPEEQRCCPNCGTPYKPMVGAYAVSLVLDWAVAVFYRRYLRQKYQPACSCPGIKRIVVAPPPAKVVARGLLSPQFIARLCVEKFCLGHPLHRILHALRLNIPAQAVSRGGVTRLLRRVGPLLQPLYDAIGDEVRRATLVGGDETTGTVHCPDDDPQRPPDHRPGWWNWCFSCATAVVFLLRQSRGEDVPFAFFGWDKHKGPPRHPQLILLTDCYVVYKALAGWVVNAFCWDHLRRRLLKAARDEATVAAARWAENWRLRIHTLYELTAARRAAGAEAWAAADQALRAHVAKMKATAERQLHDSALPPERRGALESLLRHWVGLTLFLDHPEVPLDNNERERILRGPVVGRKNFRFFGSIWSAHLAEMLWSILATAERNGLNPLTYLIAYLQACADNGHRPLEGAALQRFLPWAASAEDRATWSAPPPSVLQLSFAPRTPAPRRRRACRRPAPALAPAAAPAAVDSS